MLSKLKQEKLLLSLKSYCKKYMHGGIKELDESGTRIMINTFLSEVLGYLQIEEIKTEYMIRGTYADYVIQTKGIRHFLVEVKAFSLSLSENHLRQAINYGANEGIEYAMLTNGKQFDFYKIIFSKPIESEKIFTIDLSEGLHLKQAVEFLQFLHKDAINNNGLELLWNKTLALEPKNIAGLLYAPAIINFLKKSLKEKYKRQFSDEEIETSLKKIICLPLVFETIKPMRAQKVKEKKIKVLVPGPEAVILQETTETMEGV